MLRPLSVRLTFFYTLLFAILSLVVFRVIDYNLEASLLKRVDAGFLADGRECVHIYQDHGLEGVSHEIQLETTGAGNEDRFMRVYSADSELVSSSDMARWVGLPARIEVREVRQRGPFQTIALAGSAERVRIFHQDLGDGYLLQIGESLRDDERLLKDFRRVFFLSFFTMLFGGVVIGFYVAKRELSGIQRVQHGADQMSRGDLTQRIAFHGGSEEIRKLTWSFNRMQDRIQILISELHDVTNNVAHDLRSPVTRMRGLAETTLTGDQSLDEYRELAGTVVEESDRLVGMINVMLEIAETDAGLRSLSHDRVDMKEIVEDVSELYSSVAQDKRISLTTQISADSLLLHGDRSRLQRALANILDNAMKFTPQGGDVEISARSAGQRIFVTVADSGPGIPADDLPRIYDRFFRGDQSRSTPGSGLGLSLVQAIVRAHGGEVSVSNLEPRGARIELSFPALSS